MDRTRKVRSGCKDGCGHSICFAKAQAARSVPRRSGTTDSDRADKVGARGGKLD